MKNVIIMLSAHMAIMFALEYFWGVDIAYYALGVIMTNGHLILYKDDK